MWEEKQERRKVKIERLRAYVDEGLAGGQGRAVTATKLNAALHGARNASEALDG
jgi:hypothetical protein